MNIYKSIDELIGATPILRLNNIENEFGLNAGILAKLEFFNPTGSAKDRIAKAMILNAKNEGKITPNTVIIEPTSGNTGIGLASVAASHGYKAIIVMPDTMSAERIKLMRAYGAEVVLTDGKKGMAGAIEKAEELARKYPDSFIPSQFDNPTNPKAHYDTTGPEIFRDTDGKIDIFVAGIEGIIFVFYRFFTFCKVTEGVPQTVCGFFMYRHVHNRYSPFRTCSYRSLLFEIL